MVRNDRLFKLMIACIISEILLSVILFCSEYFFTIKQMSQIIIFIVMILLGFLILWLVKNLNTFDKHQ